MRSSRSVANLFSRDGPDYAHRGLHDSLIPENSLASFEAAVAGGHGVECDVRRSRDGVAMVFHDATLHRLCASGLNTEASEAALLSSHRLLGTDETIPTLRQLLDLVAGRVPILIELKSPHRGARLGSMAPLCLAVAADLDGYGGPVGVMSFSPAVGRWFARHRPDVARGIVVGAQESRLQRRFKRAVSRAQFAAIGVEAAGTRWAARWARQIPLGCWTVRDEVQRKRVTEAGFVPIFEGDGRPGPRN